MLQSSLATFEIGQSTVAALILLVENSDANIVSLSSYLRANGYRIQVVKDGQAAIEVAQAELPNIILMGHS